MRRYLANLAMRDDAGTGSSAGEDRASRFNEFGDTLVEILLALVVLSLASLALIIAFSTTISASAEHRRLATAQIVLSSTSEQAVSGISNTLSLFQNCTPTPSLATYTAAAAMNIPAIYSNQFSVAVTQVQYWNRATSSFQSACLVGAPQMITVTATDSSGHSFANSFVVNYPLANSNQNSFSGSADHLVFAAQPPSTNTSGAPFATQPVVDIVDASGNIVTTDLSPVILSIYSGTSGAVLSGCTGNEISGEVTFTGCAINTAGTYVLQASDGTLTSALTSSFSVTGTAPYVKFTTQPVAAASGSTFNTQPVIQVWSGSSLDTTWSGTVSLSTSGGIMSCAGLTPVNGVFTLTVTNGIAPALNCSFKGAYFNDPISGLNQGVPYTMTATTSGLIPATSNAFAVTGPGPASQMAFTQQPSGVASNTASDLWPTQPIVTFEDAFGNVASTSSNPVTLSMNGGGGSLAGCTSSTSGGVVTFSGCHGSAYGVGMTLTASSSGIPNVNSATFGITGLSSSIVFTTQPVAGVSGGTMPTQPVITVYDSGGRVVTAESTPITLQPSGGVLQYCTGLTPVNGVISVATCTFAGLVGTNYTMTATMATTHGTLTATSGTFSPTDPGTPSQVAFTTDPVAGAAGSLFTTQPVVKVEDSAGNVVTLSSAQISLSASGGTLASCSNLIAVTGVVNVAGCTFGGVVATPYTITASSAGLTSDTAVVTPTGPGPATSILVSSGSGQTATVVTTFASPLAALVTDNWGNGVPGVVVSFSAPVSGATASFSGGVTTATTNALGIATSANVTASQVAGTFNVTASAGLSSNATFSETNTAKRTNDSMTIVQGNSQSTTVGTSFGVVPEVRIVDEYGNPVSGMNVTFSAPSSGATGTFAPCSSNPTSYSCVATTDANGNAFASVVTASHLVGSYSVSTSASGVASPSTFSLTNLVGNAAQVVITPSPTSVQASATTNVTLSLQLEDQYGNPTTSTGTTTLTLSTSSTKGFFSSTLGGTGALGGTITVPFANGVGTATTYYGDEKAASPTITAKNGTTWGAASLTIVAGPPTTLSVSTGSGQSATVAANFSAPMVALATDTFGNPVSGVNVTFTAPGSGASAAFSGSSTTTATTNASGLATSATFTANHVAGGYGVVASAAGLSSATFTETNVAGPATSVTVVSGSGQSATVGAAFTSPLVVYVTDTYGNPVSGATVTFTAPGSGPSANFSGSTTTTATTASNGQATSPTLTAGHTAGVGYTITATAGTGSANFSETNTAGAAAQVVITPSPTSVQASATTNVTLSLQLEDQYGNPTTSTGTTTLTLSTSSTKGFFSSTLGGSGALGGTITVPFANGVGTATTYYGDEKAASPTITATNGTAWGTRTVTITAGAANNIAITSGSGQSAVVAANFTNPLAATVTDTWGNPVAGAVVTFAAPGSGASLTFAGGVNTATTNASGVATSGTMTANHVAGANYSISASATGTNTVNFTETNTAGAATTIAVVSGSGQSATVGTAFTNPLVVSVTDTYGNPVSGATVTFTAPSGVTASVNFSGGVKTAVTGTNGQATSASFSANNTSGANYSISANASGTNTVNFTETNKAGAPYQALIGASPTTAQASATTNVTLTVQLLDQYGNPTTSSTPTILTLSTNSAKGFFSTALGGTGTLGATTTVTIPANTASVLAYYGDEKAAVPTISTTYNSVVANTTVTITAGNASNIAATSGSGQSARINTAFTSSLVATVTDTWGNPVSGATVTFTAPGSGASLTFAGGVNTATTNASGVATSVTMTSNGVVGAYSVTATAGTGSVPFTETNTAGVAASIAIVSGSGQMQAPGSAFTSPLVVIVKDAGGNPVSGASVTFTAPASGASGTFAGSVKTYTVNTGSNGQATSTTFTAGTTLGAYTVTATTGSYTVNLTETNGYNVVITANPTSAAHHNGTKTTDIQLSLQLQNESGANVTVGATTVIAMSSSSSGAAFAATNGTNGGASTINVTINSGGGTGTTYYGDSNTGTPTITAKNGTVTWGTVTVTMT